VFTARYALSPYIKQIRFVFNVVTCKNRRRQNWVCVCHMQCNLNRSRAIRDVPCVLVDVLSHGRIWQNQYVEGPWLLECDAISTAEYLSRKSLVRSSSGSSLASRAFQTSRARHQTARRRIQNDMSVSRTAVWTSDVDNVLVSQWWHCKLDFALAF
jgi:hypothetical protein